MDYLLAGKLFKFAVAMGIVYALLLLVQWCIAQNRRNELNNQDFPTFWETNNPAPYTGPERRKDCAGSCADCPKVKATEDHNE